MVVLKTEGIKKKFGKLEVIKGIDLTVNKGEVVAIIGPSGSGKSTFLRCINKLEKADEGNIYLYDDVIAQNGEYKNEVEIQHFLKNNLWLFGNEYSFIVENNKINSSNILDIIPRNVENYVDIIEVKLPNEKLFNFDESHKNFYPTSHLTKAISQVQPLPQKSPN